jgi:hypothetical protein
MEERLEESSLSSMEILSSSPLGYSTQRLGILMVSRYLNRASIQKLVQPSVLRLHTSLGKNLALIFRAENQPSNLSSSIKNQYLDFKLFPISHSIFDSLIYLCDQRIIQITAIVLSDFGIMMAGIL